MFFKRRRQKRAEQQIIEKVASLPEPWRDRPDLSLMPVEVLFQIADKKRLSQIFRMEQPLMGFIQEDILENGITGFGEIVLDEAGRVVLRDGHHRLLICERCGIKWLPVVFSSSPRIRMEAMPFVDFLTLLGQHYRTLI